MRPLDQPTYLKRKLGGDHSMLVTCGWAEAIKVQVVQGPSGMVKPKLVEPQLPRCKRYRTATIAQPPSARSAPTRGQTRARVGLVRVPLPAGPTSMFRGQGNEQGTYSRSKNVHTVWNTGSPTGRESYGDGASVVVRGWESHPHGEGRQANLMYHAMRCARCEQPKV